MIRELFYRLIHKRYPSAPAEVLSDVRRYIDSYTDHCAEESLDEYLVRSESIVMPDEITGSDVMERDTADLYEPDELQEAMMAPMASLPDMASAPDAASLPELDDYFDHLEDTFQQTLLAAIDRRGIKDSQVYRRANLDRRLFSKIRSNVNYKPSKNTALSLAIALGLDLDETTDLLRKAGLAFSPSSRADMIIKYCITHEIYDIFEVNAILYEYDQPLLGSASA